MSSDVEFTLLAYRPHPWPDTSTGSPSADTGSPAIVTGGSSPSFRTVRPPLVDRCQPAAGACGGVSSRPRKSFVPPRTVRPHTVTDSSFCGRPTLSRLNTSAASGVVEAPGGGGDAAPRAAAARSLAISAETPARRAPGFENQSWITTAWDSGAMTVDAGAVSCADPLVGVPPTTKARATVPRSGAMTLRMMPPVQEFSTSERRLRDKHPDRDRVASHPKSPRSDFRPAGAV